MVGGVRHVRTDRVLQNRIRAKKCRELIALIDKPDAVAILTEYARELEERADQLEASASVPKADYARPAARHA